MKHDRIGSWPCSLLRFRIAASAYPPALGFCPCIGVLALFLLRIEAPTAI